MAARAHPLQGHGARAPEAGDAGVLPGRPVPGERHHRRGQAGARAAGRAGERPPHVHVRHRAGPTVSLTFDNLGEVADLERGRWPADAPLGRHASVTRTLPRVLELLASADVRATFFVEGLNAELYPDALRSIADAGHEVAFHGWQHERWAELSPDEERESFERGVTALDALGLRPVGFRPPGGELTRRFAGAAARVRVRVLLAAGDGGRAARRSGIPAVPLGAGRRAVLPAALRRPARRGGAAAAGAPARSDRSGRRLRRAHLPPVPARGRGAVRGAALGAGACPVGPVPRGGAGGNCGWVGEAGMPAARAVPGALNGHMPVKAPCVWRPRSGRHPSSPTQPQLTFVSRGGPTAAPARAQACERRPRASTAAARSARRACRARRRRSPRRPSPASTRPSAWRRG